MTQVVETSNVIPIGGETPAKRGIIRKPTQAKLERYEKAAMNRLGQYVILSPAMFALSSGYCMVKAKTALKGLFDKGLADRGYYCPPRTERETVMALPSRFSELAYKLTKKGYERGVTEGMIDPDAHRIAKAWNGHAPDDMNHRLLVVEFMIKIGMEISAQDRLSIARMVPDFVFKDGLRATTDKVAKDRIIVPDLVLEIEAFSGRNSTLFFCEVENTRLQPHSKNNRRPTIASKIKPYGPYLKSSLRKTSGAEQDVVLYLMNQPPDHLDAMIELVPWDDVGAVAKLVRLTTFDDIREHGVLNGRWRDCRGELVRITG